MGKHIGEPLVLDEKVVAVLTKGMGYGFLRLGLFDPRNHPERKSPLEDNAILSAQEEEKESK